jgi:hypothetical protein
LILIKSPDFTSSKLGMPVISVQLEKIAHTSFAINIRLPNGNKALVFAQSGYVYLNNICDAV